MMTIIMVHTFNLMSATRKPEEMKKLYESGEIVVIKETGLSYLKIVDKKPITKQ